MIRLIIFDLDGTLIDSAPDIIITTNTLLAQRGRAPLPNETIVAAIGEGLKKLVFGLFPETHGDPELLAQLDREFYQLYEENLTTRTQIFDGAVNFASTCGAQIAIVTNKPSRLAIKAIAQLGLDKLPWVRVFGADSLANRKPDPLPLIEVMKAAGVERHETVMVGDGIPDMIAARRAGVHAIAIEFGYTPLEILKAQGATTTLASYRELPRVLAEIEKLPPREIEPS